MTKLATCCFLALATVNAALEWLDPPVRAASIDQRDGR